MTFGQPPLPHTASCLPFDTSAVHVLELAIDSKTQTLTSHAKSGRSLEHMAKALHGVRLAAPRRTKQKCCFLEGSNQRQRMKMPTATENAPTRFCGQSQVHKMSNKMPTETNSKARKAVKRHSGQGFLRLCLQIVVLHDAVLTPQIPVEAKCTSRHR